MQGVVAIEVGRLVGHPRNSNVMGREGLAKLMRHIKRSGRYPPLIVRRFTAESAAHAEKGSPRTSRRAAREEGKGQEVQKHAATTPRSAVANEEGGRDARPAGNDADGGGSSRAGEELYQVLDGHQRLEVLKRLGRKTAQCVVWEGVDDAAALVLLATLNRLRGTEDPRKRGLLLQEISTKVEAEELGRLLPEGAGEIERLLEWAQPAPELAKPRRLEDWPVAVHFFLVEEDRKRLEKALKAVGGTREEALMGMVKRIEAQRHEGR